MEIIFRPLNPQWIYDSVLIEGKYFSSENFLFRILIFYYDLRSGRCFNEFLASFPSLTLVLVSFFISRRKLEGREN